MNRMRPPPCVRCQDLLQHRLSSCHRLSAKTGRAGIARHGVNAGPATPLKATCGVRVLPAVPSHCLRTGFNLLCRPTARPMVAGAAVVGGRCQLAAAGAWSWSRDHSGQPTCGNLPFQRYPQLPTAGDIQRCGVICAAQDERAPFSGRHFSDAITVTWCPVEPC